MGRERGLENGVDPGSRKFHSSSSREDLTLNLLRSSRREVGEASKFECLIFDFLGGFNQSPDHDLGQHR